MYIHSRSKLHATNELVNCLTMCQLTFTSSAVRAFCGITLYLLLFTTGKNGGMGPYSYQNGGDWTWFGGRMAARLVQYGLLADAREVIRPINVYT